FYPHLMHDNKRGARVSKRLENGLADRVRQVLTEGRMTLPGAQALLGFGMIAVLMEAFRELPLILKVVHLIGLCCIASVIVLLMTPGAYHRIAEEGENSERFHRIATRFLLAAMALLALGLSAGIWVVFEIITGSRAA